MVLTTAIPAARRRFLDTVLVRDKTMIPKCHRASAILFLRRLAASNIKYSQYRLRYKEAYRLEHCSALGPFAFKDMLRNFVDMGVQRMSAGTGGLVGEDMNGYS